MTLQYLFSGLQIPEEYIADLAKAGITTVESLKDLRMARLKELMPNTMHRGKLELWIVRRWPGWQAAQQKSPTATNSEGKK
jgi:hypothetical protein